MSWWCRVWKWTCFFYGRGACQKCGQIRPVYRTFLLNCPANVIFVLCRYVHFVEQNGTNKHGNFPAMVVDIASFDIMWQLVSDSLSIAKDLLVVFRLLFNLCRPLLSIFSWQGACNLEAFMLLSQQLSIFNPFHQNSTSLSNVRKIHDIKHYTWLESISDFIKQTKGSKVGLFRVRISRMVTILLWVLHVRSSSCQLTHALDLPPQYQ